jgi:hypothetical protein
MLVSVVGVTGATNVLLDADGIPAARNAAL